MPPANALVIGGGPAGYTAALYLARAGLEPVCIEGYAAGGQLLLTGRVENFPGFPDGILGPDLVTNLRTQAERFGARFERRDVTAVDLSQRPFRVATPNIKLLIPYTVDEVLGVAEGRLNGLALRDAETNQIRIEPMDAMFVAIGHTPNSELFAGSVACDEDGYVLVDPGSTRTSVEGVFAAGDVHDRQFRQAITSAGSGCIAALEAERWLAVQGLAGERLSASAA
jgi:thioredoxin reductase